MYISPYGKPDGLAERLEKFAEDLSKNRNYPWMGSGILDDLRCAAAVISGKPVPLTGDERMAAESVEYDL